jgi:DNA-binding transcriptional LysR family regulator
MDLRQVEYVVGVVDHGTFTAAAARLHVSQPSLSQGIGRLEAELGTPLFHRVGRGAVLSAAGEAFLGPARRMLREARLARESVEAVSELEAGTLDLVALPTLAADPVAVAVGRLRSAHPGVVVRIAEPEAARAVADRVADGRAEIGLTDALAAGEDLVVEHLVDQELVLVRPPGSDPRPVRVAALAGIEFVTTPVGTSTRRHLDEALARGETEPRIAVETDQREAIVPLVLAGAGAALLPRVPAELAGQRGAVVAPVIPALRRSIALVYRPGALSPAASRFRDLAHDVVSTPRTCAS